MKAFILLTILFFLILIALFFLASYSRKPPSLGLLDQRLRPCPNKPNCVCSESYQTINQAHKIAAFSYHNKHANTAWDSLINIITAQGGIIKQNANGYLWAIFETKHWRFTDDVEARMDKTQQKIHIRSASRIGYSDFGVNAKRVERLRLAFIRTQSTD